MDSSHAQTTEILQYCKYCDYTTPNKPTLRANRRRNHSNEKKRVNAWVFINAKTVVKILSRKKGWTRTQQNVKNHSLFQAFQTNKKAKITQKLKEKNKKYIKDKNNIFLSLRILEFVDLCCTPFLKEVRTAKAAKKETREEHHTDLSTGSKNF